MMLHRFPVLVRRFSVIQDMAKRVLLDNAVNSLKAGGSELLGGVGGGGVGGGGGPQVAHLSPNVEVDADTWRSIVDSPVVDVEGMESSDLYPSSAPSLASLTAHSARSSEPWREEEGGGALDLSAFPGALTTDPFAYVASDLRGINSSIKELLGVDHPMLSTVARYFFDWDGGKKVRPALVLLMAHAVNTHMAACTVGGRYTAGGHFTPSPAEVAAASDALTAGMPALLPGSTRTPLPAQVVLPLQRRLAEITELIHTASLLHDDVLDGADTRRGVGSVNKMFGNKLAVLSGDFLLARASVCLARLRNVPAVELLSTVIEHLVKGEVMQMHVALRNQQSIQSAFDVYLRKTYFKTGSLIANSCKAISILGGYPDYVTKAAFEYGFHVGIAFQLVDDMLDFEGTTLSLGKPALNDITQGLATAPVLFAAHRYPNLLPIIQRKFEVPGDVDMAVKGIQAAGGMALTRKLAVAHGQLALDALKPLADSPARTALASMVSKILSRSR